MPWSNVRLLGEFEYHRYAYLPSENGYDLAIAELPGREPDHVLVISTKGGIPERRRLEWHMDALQFLYSRRLQVSFLRGVDDDGSPTESLIGSAIGRMESDPLFAYWPTPDLRFCWAAPAFAKLIPLIEEGPPVARLALEYFLTSFRGPFDEAYLKLVVVLEGLAMEVLADVGAANGIVTESEGKLWSVKDAAKWKDLLATLKNTEEYKAWRALLDGSSKDIRGHALKVEGLVDWSESLCAGFRLRPDFGELSAGQRVKAAFAAVGLRLDRAMEDESKRWHQVRHVGVAKMADAGSLKEHIAVVRTMVVALLFRWIGYDGPVIGYTRDSRGRWEIAPVDWWGDPVTGASAVSARTRFVYGQA